MFKSSNPLLSRMDNNVQMLEGTPMTVSGTITKTFILLLIAQYQQLQLFMKHLWAIQIK